MPATSSIPAVPLTRTWSAVLFDLDGTILDSAPGVISSLKHLHESFDLEVPSDAELLTWIGPPIHESFRERIGFDDDNINDALEVYRSHYLAQAHHGAVFPGVAGVLAQLANAGIPVALATSKREVAARMILDDLGLTEYFTVIVGSTDDWSRCTKTEVVAEALNQLEALGIDLDSPVMVGDREHDTIGAAANNVPTILVEWGYGSPVEAADSLAVVASADQLRKLLLGS